LSLFVPIIAHSIALSYSQILVTYNDLVTVTTGLQFPLLELGRHDGPVLVVAARAGRDLLL